MSRARSERGRRILDISPPLTPSLAVFPGDTPLSREPLLEIEKGDPITLSTLRATVHLGAHADAPSHYAAGGEPIDRLDPAVFLGPAHVVRVEPGRGGRVTPAMVRAEIRAPRILFATGTWPDPGVFNPDFAALDPALVEWLHARAVRLVGVDTPSVDPADSKKLPAHRTVARCRMTILEGLVLAGVPEGVYELIALPLRLVGFDASPVRAVLRALE